MPKVTINGKTIEVSPDTTIIEAGDMLGIHIPRFCYHPELKVDGNCRMCLVGVEGVDQLMIACDTKVDHDMVVRTDTEDVKKAVKGVLEMLLVHHPIDCPICDQSGECYLQDYYVEHGLYKSRFPLKEKIRKVKVKDIGGDIILDAERCVLCTRCIRFLRDVTGTDELNIFDRSAYSYIDIYDGRPLNNRYTCNLADICPVGALTSKDFRFRCRVWYLEEEKSICPGCARGCNVFLHHFDGALWRMKPRMNREVNGAWMCDIGRVSYRVSNEGRVTRNDVMRSAGLSAFDWDALLHVAAGLIGNVKERGGAATIALIASPRQSNEEIYLTKKLATEVIGTPHLAFTPDVLADDYSDDFLVHPDKNPNSRGAEVLDIVPGEGGLDFDGIVDAAGKGRIELLIVMGSFLGSLDDEKTGALLESVGFTLNMASNVSALATFSNLLLPSASLAEKRGTFVNCDGRVQLFHPAYPPKEPAREDIWILTQLAKKLGAGWEYGSSGDIFNEMSEKIPFFRGLSYEEIGDHGKMGNI